jgi:hypothetical protein
MHHASTHTTPIHLLPWMAMAFLVLAGCAVGAAGTPASSPTDATPATTVIAPSATTPAPTRKAAPPTPKLLTAPPATPSPSPRAVGKAVYVQGWEVCMPPGFTVTGPDASGTSRVRDGGFTCTDEMNDPRVSGTTQGEWLMDGWGGGPNGPGALVQWSRRMELSNDGGTWAGTYAGFAVPGIGDKIAIWYKGEGGYAGLSYVQWIEAAPGQVLGGTPVIGLIYPGDVPPTVTEAIPAP